MNQLIDFICTIYYAIIINVQYIYFYLYIIKCISYFNCELYTIVISVIVSILNKVISNYLIINIVRYSIYKYLYIHYIFTCIKYNLMMDSSWFHTQCTYFLIKRIIILPSFIWSIIVTHDIPAFYTKITLCIDIFVVVFIL